MTNEKDRVAARRVIHTLGSITGFENRVDLVLAAFATVRAEAFKDIHDLITTVNPKLTFGSANGSIMKNAILQAVDMFIASEAALEAAATENRKGEG